MNIKKIFLILTFIFLLGNLTGCSSNCKADGCDREIYRNGLCSKHSLDASIENSHKLQEEINSLQQELDEINKKLDNN